ncbi:unnamed protein product [Rotaria sp. Silwood1]|nr:unnamed protein product [Rotaria sp. Silwood1]
MTLSLFIIILYLINNNFNLFFTLNEFCNNKLLINSKNNISEEYIPLHYFILKTFIIINSCNTNKSIFIRNHTFYKYDHEQYQWKRLCISQKIFNTQIPIVNSIAHLNNDLILIINGILFRTKNIISSSNNNDIIYTLLRYSNIPILFDKIDYVFTTPCCTCFKTSTISNIFNDYIILANKFGNVILFYFKTMTVVYNFENIFQSQTICQLNQCLILSDVTINGCQYNYLNYMNEDQLKNYYTNLNINYDNITLITKEIYCLNITIDYIFVLNNEFFIVTKNNEWLYGKESFLPSMINLQQYKECNLIFQNIQNFIIPPIDLNISQCLLNINKQLLSCSMFVQSSCSYIFFKPLFDINKIYILEKNSQKYFKFILQAYTIIPIMIVSTKSILLNYSINYTINRLNTGIVQIIGDILVSTINQTSNDLYDSSLITIRLDLLQYSYSCSQPSFFSFQIEASCSSASILRIEQNIEFEIWNESNPIIDIEWIRKNLLTNSIHQFSSVYIKRKQNDPILLKYQYCFNQTCQSINDDQLNSLIIYAIPLNKEHEIYAHYLINRLDSCIPISRSIYHLWLKWALNTTAKNQFFQIPYERRTFYRTLLNTFAISTNSCLFFNGSSSIHINESINQASDDYLKFILHIITYNNKYRNKYLKYHRLNQIDAGQFHQWYDIAQYLNANKYTNNYNLICNYLKNLQSTTNLTNRLMEYHT